MESKYLSHRPPCILSGVKQPGRPDAVAIGHAFATFPSSSWQISASAVFSPLLPHSVFRFWSGHRGPRPPPRRPPSPRVGVGGGAFTKLTEAAGAVIVRVGRDRAEEDPFLWRVRTGLQAWAQMSRECNLLKIMQPSLSLWIGSS